MLVSLLFRSIDCQEERFLSKVANRLTGIFQVSELVDDKESKSDSQD